MGNSEVERWQSLFNNRLLRAIKKPLKDTQILSEKKKVPHLKSKNKLISYLWTPPKLICRGCNEELDNQSTNDYCHNFKKCTKREDGSLKIIPKNLYNSTKNRKQLSSLFFVLSLIFFSGSGVIDPSKSTASLFLGETENYIKVIDPFLIFISFFLLFLGFFILYGLSKIKHSKNKGIFKMFIHNEKEHPIYFSSKN